ncbi:hypothetical protein OAH18_03795, partial [bacterium]|nr:hypothetical protein [bacterium]
PNCGSLLWFEGPIDHETISQLSQRGVTVDFDELAGIVIRFTGHIYTDSAVSLLARIPDADVVDIRATKITTAGAERLRRQMPQTVIFHE